MKYGYARVSTQDQHLHLQTDALKKAGCERIFTEKGSAVKERPVLTQLLETLESGDSLVVWKLDRLGRSLRDLVTLTNQFSERGIVFTSLQDNINTDTAQGRLFFGIMASLAEFERELIRERTNAGLAAARSRGRKGGRPPGLREADKKTARIAYQLHQNKAIPVGDIISQLRISKGTMYRYIKFAKEEQNFSIITLPSTPNT
jgi:DNA invertase Pin-like site-specific DNA recombinase